MTHNQFRGPAEHLSGVAQTCSVRLSPACAWQGVESSRCVGPCARLADRIPRCSRLQICVAGNRRRFPTISSDNDRVQLCAAPSDRRRDRQVPGRCPEGGMIMEPLPAEALHVTHISALDFQPSHSQHPGLGGARHHFPCRALGALAARLRTQFARRKERAVNLTRRTRRLFPEEPDNRGRLADADACAVKIAGICVWGGRLVRPRHAHSDGSGDVHFRAGLVPHLARRPVLQLPALLRWSR